MTSTAKNIIVTGAGGLVGPLLAGRLVKDGYRVFMTDLVRPSLPNGIEQAERVQCLQGDMCDAGFVKTVLEAARPIQAIFILHGIMSAGSEADYDLSIKVNVDSVRSLLLAIRQTQAGVRTIYASSQAVFGRPLPAVVTDAVTPTPESTYGAHKLATEIMLNDMHRRGFVDAFIVRLPTLVVRPGAPTAAASSWLSGMIREPLRGRVCVIPLRDRSFRSYLTSPSRTIENLVRVLELDSAALPKHIRHINLPGISVSTQELMDPLAKYGGHDKLQLLREESQPELETILRSWPSDFDATTPNGLGLVADGTAEDLVREYVESLQQQQQ